jgi:sigma-B regulation protein RsbU (phosphoserine phosphatase)
MVTAENSETMLGDDLTLFARTEVFIYVFMEIVTKIEFIQRVLFGKAKLFDYIIFILIFGGFSIFGTLIGTPVNSGGIANIRDLSPMIAGLAAGPVVGLAVGLIGGIHRLSLGGVTCLACSMATILSGLLAGIIYLLNGKKLLDIIPAMLFAAGIELLHAGLALAISRPITVALEVVLTAMPGMIIANSLGIAICVIVIRNTKETVKPTVSI